MDEPASPLGEAGEKGPRGTKVRRVYDAAQTPMERVLAGAQAKPKRVAELKKLRQSPDPFQLGKWIDQKLQRIYDWRIGGSVRR